MTRYASLGMLRHHLAMLLAALALAATLSGCTTPTRVLIWDVPAYRTWAATTDSPSFVPRPNMPEEFARSAFRQGRLLAMEIYAHRLKPSDPSSLLGVIDSLGDAALLEDPAIREAIERYARDGVFITRWADDPVAARAHLALDQVASRNDAVWTHQKAAKNTDESVSSYRLRKKTMPVHVRN